MTIGPCRMFAARCPRAIEQTRLRQQNKRMIGVLAVSHCLLRGSNLFKASSQMHRRGSQAIDCLPRNRCVQRIVHFEDAGSVAEALQPSPVALRESFPANFDELTRSQITEKEIIVRQSRQTLDRR